MRDITKQATKEESKVCYFKITQLKKKYKREKILKQKIDKQNSMRIELWKDGKHKTFLVARLIETTFLEDLIETNLTVNHKDGNRLNNNVENLEWVTRGDNIRHAFETNLMPYKKIKIIDKRKNEVVFIGSKTKASSYIGYNAGYICNAMKRNKYENETYKWEYL